METKNSEKRNIITIILDGLLALGVYLILNNLSEIIKEELSGSLPSYYNHIIIALAILFFILAAAIPDYKTDAILTKKTKIKIIIFSYAISTLLIIYLSTYLGEYRTYGVLLFFYLLLAIPWFAKLIYSSVGGK